MLIFINFILKLMSNIKKVAKLLERIVFLRKMKDNKTLEYRIINN